MSTNDGWILIRDKPPQEGVTVYTKIDDGTAPSRNYQNLKRRGNLWFFPDDSMYVYYTPTHWKPL